MKKLTLREWLILFVGIVLFLISLFEPSKTIARQRHYDFDESRARTYNFVTDNGVQCIYVGMWNANGEGGGLSCNWEKYNEENK